MPFSKKIEEIKSMLPLYSKRILAEKDKEQIGRVVGEDTELQKELNFWNMVNVGYERLKKELPEPSEHVYSKIVKKIGKKKKKKEEFFNIFRLNPKISFSLIVIEFFLILGLIFYVLNLKYEYKTLSVSDSKAETSSTINVVFKENVTEREIRELLIKIDGRIVDGPSKTGLYLVMIKNKVNRDKALDFLRESSIIFVAEPAY